MSNLTRKTGFLFVKYTPAIMSITCSIKIFLLCIDRDSYFTTNYVVNIINLVTDIGIVVGVYSLGKCLNYCWKHQSLCRAALVGYLNYAVYIACDISSELFLHITIAYVVLVLIMTFTYYELK